MEKSGEKTMSLTSEQAAVDRDLHDFPVREVEYSELFSDAELGVHRVEDVILLEHAARTLEGPIRELERRETRMLRDLRYILGSQVDPKSSFENATEQQRLFVCQQLEPVADLLRSRHTLETLLPLLRICTQSIQHALHRKRSLLGLLLEEKEGSSNIPPS